MFFDTTTTNSKTFDKINFLTFDVGTHRVRLLPEPKVIFIHYLPGKGTVECLGKDCPICENNKRMQIEHPEDYSKMPGYNKASRRHYVNILDKTSVKVCPNCGHENKKDMTNRFSPACTKCNTFITGVEETISNKVKIANLSNTTADQVNALAGGQLDTEGNVKSISSYDFVFMVTMTGGKKIITPMPDSNATDPLPDVSDMLYDLSRAVIKLDRSEIINLVNGVALRDIFAARKVTVAEEAAVDETSVSEVQSQLDNLFKM